MKYSIILNNYNKEKYLRRCLDSIVNQNFKTFELVIVDDCSTDNSVDIIKSYNLDCKLIINSENKGLSISRNIGVDNSTGDYVLFVDSDDCLLNFMHLLNESCIKDSFNHMVYMYNSLRYTKDDKYLDRIGLTNKSLHNPNILLDIFISAFQTTKLYNRKFLIDNNIRNVEFRCYTQDRLFNTVVYSYLKYYDLKVYHTGLDGYHYNTWSDNTTNSITRLERLSTFKKGAELLYNQYKDSKISDIICPELTKLIDLCDKYINKLNKI